MDIVILIPAYCPGRELAGVIHSIRETAMIPVVVVDDGSGPPYESVFRQIQSETSVVVLRHDVNRGKGAALKTGLDYVLANCPGVMGVVTADADGQHEAADILAVSARFTAEPSCLVLGSRRFDSDVPWRNRFGNQITRAVFRTLVGVRLSDTQTGLRAIPREFLPSLLNISENGYEFEMAMLIASRRIGLRILEEPIKTVYGGAKSQSHFKPFADSAKIYGVLFRALLHSRR
jgi:glycosyltransferase involved in cell wall biosynthesis